MSLINDIKEIQALCEEFKQVSPFVLETYLTENLREFDGHTSLPDLFKAIGEGLRVHQDEILDAANGHDPANGNDQNALRDAMGWNEPEFPSMWGQT